MQEHSCAKGESNHCKDGIVIVTDVRTCPPLHKLIFTTSILEYLSVYLYLYSYIGANENF